METPKIAHLIDLHSQAAQFYAQTRLKDLTPQGTGDLDDSQRAYDHARTCAHYGDLLLPGFIIDFAAYWTKKRQVRRRV